MNTLQIIRDETFTHPIDINEGDNRRFINCRFMGGVRWPQESHSVVMIDCEIVQDQVIHHAAICLGDGAVFYKCTASFKNAILQTSATSASTSAAMADRTAP